MSNRLRDAGEIERRLLELAHTTDAKLTAAALAYYAPCSVEDAASVLDNLAIHDRMTMDIEDDGTIVYTLLGRQQLAPVARPRALVQVARVPHAVSPLLAAVLSAVIPGAGHLYAGKAVSAVLWFLVVGLGYLLILPGLVLHVFAMASAARAARRVNTHEARLALAQPAFG